MISIFTHGFIDERYFPNRANHLSVLTSHYIPFSFCASKNISSTSSATKFCSILKKNLTFTVTHHPTIQAQKYPFYESQKKKKILIIIPRIICLDSGTGWNCDNSSNAPPHLVKFCNHSINQTNNPENRIKIQLPASVLNEIKILENSFINRIYRKRVQTSASRGFFS